MRWPLRKLGSTRSRLVDALIGKRKLSHLPINAQPYDSTSLHAELHGTSVNHQTSTNCSY